MKVDLPNYIEFMLANDETLRSLVKSGINFNLTKEDFIIVMDQMWNMCPHHKKMEK